MLTKVSSKICCSLQTASPLTVVKETGQSKLDDAVVVVVVVRDVVVDTVVSGISSIRKHIFIIH